MKLKSQQDSIASSSLDEKKKYSRKKSCSRIKRKREKVKSYCDTLKSHGDHDVVSTGLTNVNQVDDCKDDYLACFSQENEVMPSLHTISEPSEESVSCSESDQEFQSSSCYDRVSIMTIREIARILQSIKQPQMLCSKEWPRTHTSFPVYINDVEEETESISWIEIYLHKITTFGAPISVPKAAHKNEAKDTSDKET